MAAPSPSLDLDEIYAFAVQTSKAAGELLLAAARRRISGGRAAGGEAGKEAIEKEKENAVDIVTKVDEGMSCVYGYSIGAALLLRAKMHWLRWPC